MKFQKFFLIPFFVFVSCAKSENASSIKLASYYKPIKSTKNLEFTEAGNRFLRDIYFFNSLKSEKNKTFLEQRNQKNLLEGLFKITCLLESIGNIKVINFLEKCNTINYINFLIRIVSTDTCPKRNVSFTSAFGNYENDLPRIRIYEEILLREIENLLVLNYSTPKFGSISGIFHNEREPIVDKVDTLGEKYCGGQKFVTPQKKN